MIPQIRPCSNGPPGQKNACLPRHALLDDLRFFFRQFAGFAPASQLFTCSRLSPTAPAICSGVSPIRERFKVVEWALFFPPCASPIFLPCSSPIFRPYSSPIFRPCSSPIFRPRSMILSDTSHMISTPPSSRFR